MDAGNDGEPSSLSLAMEQKRFRMLSVCDTLDGQASLER